MQRLHYSVVLVFLLYNKVDQLYVYVNPLSLLESFLASSMLLDPVIAESYQPTPCAYAAGSHSAVCCGRVVASICQCCSLSSSHLLLPLLSTSPSFSTSASLFLPYKTGSSILFFFPYACIIIRLFEVVNNLVCFLIVAKPVLLPLWEMRNLKEKWSDLWSIWRMSLSIFI